MATLPPIVSYLQENPWIVGIIMLVVGFLVTYYGKRFLPWVIAIFSGGATFFIVLLFCSLFGMLDYIDPTQDEGSVGLVVLSFLLATAAGVLVGFFMKKFFFYGFIVLGFIAGYFAGNLLYNLVLIGLVQSSVLFFFVTFGCGAIAAYLCYKRKKELAIITTAFLGAYCFVRGISIFAGGFPNEYALYEELSNGTAEFTPVFIAYLAGIGLMTISGIWW